MTILLLMTDDFDLYLFRETFSFMIRIVNEGCDRDVEGQFRLGSFRRSIPIKFYDVLQDIFFKSFRIFYFPTPLNVIMNMPYDKN